LFFHLLIIANYETKKWKGKSVKRGQVIVGRKALAESSGLTEQQIRTALKKLKATNEITSTSTNDFTLVTIVNWELYQSKEDEATNEITSTSTNEQPTNNQRITTTKETKNIRILHTEENVNLPNDDFGDISQSIQKILNLGVPVNTLRVRDWLSAGADKELILTVVSALTARKGDDPPRSLKYFDRAIAEAIADKNNPMEIPDAKTIRNNTNYTKPTTTDAINAGLAKLAEKYRD
jgi:hypothetical protein